MNHWHNDNRNLEREDHIQNILAGLRHVGLLDGPHTVVRCFSGACWSEDVVFCAAGRTTPQSRKYFETQLDEVLFARLRETGEEPHLRMSTAQPHSVRFTWTVELPPEHEAQPKGPCI